MRKLGKIIYLKGTWATIQYRLQKSSHRPLAGPDKDWADVKLLWSKRQPFYEDADLVIMTDGLSPLMVARRIETELKERVTK
jgi:shikimate kinase